MDAVMDTVIEELRQARRSRGLTQRDVAEAIGTTQSAVARLEAGRASPRLSTLTAYASAVDLTITAAGRDVLADGARTIADSLTRADPGEALRALVQLVDDLALLPTLDALRTPPPPTGDRRWDAALAATAAWLVRRRGGAPLVWAAAPSRFLDGPWFPLADVLGRPVGPAMAAHLLVAAPAEFSGRGVLLDPDTLHSV
jgi:transcriptional regulator with XRE-family HTH domain